MSTSINNIIVLNNAYLKNIMPINGSSVQLPPGYSYLVINNSTGQLSSFQGANIDGFFDNTSPFMSELVDFSIADTTYTLDINYHVANFAPGQANTGFLPTPNRPFVPSDAPGVAKYLSDNIDAVRSDNNVPMKQPIFTTNYYKNDEVQNRYNSLFGLPFFRFKKGVAPTVIVKNQTGFTYDWHWHGLNTPANVDGASQVVEFGNNTYVNGIANPDGTFNDYTINIPPITQGAGLNWVHAHPMYYSSAQLQMGIFGLVDIVDDITAPVAQDVFTYNDNHLMLWMFDHDVNADGSLDKRNIYVDNSRDTFLMVNNHTCFPWYADQGTVPYCQPITKTTTHNLVKISMFNVGLSWRPYYVGVCDVNGNIYNFYYVQSDDGYRNPILTNIIQFEPANRGSIIIDVAQFPNNTAYLFCYNFDLTNNFNMAVDSDGNLTANVAYADAGNGNNTIAPTPIPDPNGVNPSLPSHLQYPNDIPGYYVDVNNTVNINGGRIPAPANLNLVTKKYFCKISYDGSSPSTKSLDSLITDIQKIVFGTEPNPNNPSSVSNFVYMNQVSTNTGKSITSPTFEKDAFTYPDSYVKYLNPNCFHNLPNLNSPPTRNFAFYPTTSENYFDVQNPSDSAALAPYNIYGASDFAPSNRILVDMWNSEQLLSDVNGLNTTDPSNGVLNGWITAVNNSPTNPNYKPIDASGNLILPSCLFKIAPTGSANAPTSPTNAYNFTNLSMLSNDTLYIDVFDTTGGSPFTDINDPNTNYPYWSNNVLYTYPPPSTMGTTDFTYTNIVATVKITFPTTQVTDKPMNITQWVDLVNTTFATAELLRPTLTPGPITLDGGYSYVGELLELDWTYFPYYLAALNDGTTKTGNLNQNTFYGYIQTVMMLNINKTSRYTCRLTGKWELLNFFGKTPSAMFMAPYTYTQPSATLGPPWVMNHMSSDGVNIMMYENKSFVAPHSCVCLAGCNCHDDCTCVMPPDFPNVINYIVQEINPFYGDPLNPYSNKDLASANPAGGLMTNMSDIVSFAVFPTNYQDPYTNVDYSKLDGNNNGTWKGFIDGFQNDNLFNFSVEQENTEKWLYRNWDAQDSHPFHFHLTSGYTDPNDPWNTTQLVSDDNYSVLYTYSKDTYSIGSQTQLSWYLKFNTYNGTDGSDDKVIGNLGYMYHCHYMTHHDMMMMGQYFVVPKGTYASYFSNTNVNYITSGTPSGIVSDGKTVWVCNSENGTVSLFNISGSYDGTYTTLTGQTVTNANKITNPLLLKTIVVGTQPQAICYDNTYMWVATYGSSTVSHISRATQTVVATIIVTGTPNSISSDGTYVYVATEEQKLTIINISDNSTSSLSFSGNINYVDVDDQYIWVTDKTNNQVIAILKSNYTTTTTLNVGTDPRQLVSDGTYVWVPNYASNSVSVINCNTPPSVPTVNSSSIDVGTGPVAVTYDSRYVWVSNKEDNTVSQIDPSSNPHLLNTVNVKTGTKPLGINSDGTNVWISGNGSSEIIELLI